MQLTGFQIKIVKYALCSFAVLLALSASYFFGITQGENNINARWSEAKAAHAQELLVLKGRIQERERLHRQETSDIAGALRKTEVNYEKALADLSVERSLRLRLSAQRSAEYERLAAAGSSERGDLARHTAQLDRSLEEGRGLVAELAATVGQRDAQLRMVGAQLLNDRKLLEE